MKVRLTALLLGALVIAAVLGALVVAPCPIRTY